VSWLLLQPPTAGAAAAGGCQLLKVSFEPAAADAGRQEEPQGVDFIQAVPMVPAKEEQEAV
jgi:hypothetical protein